MIDSVATTCNSGFGIGSREVLVIVYPTSLCASVVMAQAPETGVLASALAETNLAGQSQEGGAENPAPSRPRHRSAPWLLPRGLTSLCLNVFIYDPSGPLQGHCEH